MKMHQIQPESHKQKTVHSGNLKHHNKKCKKYFMVDSVTKVYFNADFDSGNLEKVQQISPYIYKLYPGFDREIHNSTQKTYFHFKVYGFRLCLVRFHIARVHILQKLLRSGQESSYKPIVRKGKDQYKKIEKGVKLYYNKSDEVELSIQYEFQQEDDWTQFAFSYPYSYDDMLKMVKELKLKYSDHSDIYYHDQVLGYSQQCRKLQMIHVTERINCSKQRQQVVDGIFPNSCQPVQPTYNKSNATNQRPFKINKPKIVISGRVHPGQSPGSYCVQGLLRFLLDEKDYRAYLLRKNFHFIIVPMLNPDGVYNGLFRLDINGQNLNRIYVNCDPLKHPTIWCFRQYLKFLQTQQNPVMFYFDFHAHPSKKQFFIYGNAFQQLTHQVQAETFGKILESNCPYFHNIDSIFTQKQMSSKDKHDKYTKEGCGRVFAHKLFGIIHSYTVECGYFSPGRLQKWQSPQQVQSRSQTFTKQYGYVSSWENCSSTTYTPESYKLMGKSILITILDLFHLNPYPRINFAQLRSIGTIRKNVAVKIYNFVQRFRLVDSNAPKKIKQLNKLMEQQYYKVKLGAYGLSISQNYGMKHPKRTFSLLSRVYMSKNDLLSKINSLGCGQKQLQNCNYIQDDPQILEHMQYQEEFPQTIQQNLQLQVANKGDQGSNLFLQQSLNVLHRQKMNIKQYRSQLQLKIPMNSKNLQKVEQIYLKQISEDCLQVNHLQTKQQFLKSKQTTRVIAKQLKNDLQRLESGKATGRYRNTPIQIEQIVKRRRIQSQKRFLKVPRSQQDSMNKLKTSQKQKSEQHKKSHSICIKTRSESRMEGEQQNIESKSKLKSTRIDAFLKSQISKDKPSMKYMSKSLQKTKSPLIKRPQQKSNGRQSEKKIGIGQLEKYITQKINHQSKKMEKHQKMGVTRNEVANLSRFPMIYSKNMEQLAGFGHNKQ